MSRLTDRGLKRLQACILELYADLNPDTFHENLVAAVSRAIPSLSVAYAELNLIQRELSKTTLSVSFELTPAQVSAFEAHMHEHPIGRLIYPQGFLLPGKKTLPRPAVPSSLPGSAVRVHDVLTQSQFRKLGLYQEFYRKLGVEYQMVLPIFTGRTLNRNLAVNRDRRDFTDEERLLLDLLGPHIVQAYANAQALADARRSFSAYERSVRDGSSPTLTRREEDVLYWVAQGKTNAETAGILKIATGTVKVHLERIYEKLGVENRTAAALFAAGNGRRAARARGAEDRSVPKRLNRQGRSSGR